jgi:RNA-directed DNA polymerase
VRETPTGRTLADLIDDLNPVITGWRNYYRYATRSGKEFAKHDWWLWWRLKAWLGKKYGGASARKLRRRYTETGAQRQGGWRSDGKKLARFADTKRLRYPDRGLRIPNGWNDPDERFRKGADKFWEATLALASL